MDVNAGRVMTGEATLDEVGSEIFDRILDVASGTPSKSEALGHREYFIPYKVQDLCANVMSTDDHSNDSGTDRTACRHPLHGRGQRHPG